MDTSKYGSTCSTVVKRFHCACFTQIASLLIDRGADIDAATETTHDSALTWASTLGNEAIVRLLLERDANVEHRTKDGCTALMFAALAGQVKVCSFEELKHD